MNNSREIKFRYYDNLMKVFVYSDDFKFASPYKRLECFFPAADKYAANGIVQQFTGLKDKNGKEIYEGDIIKWEGEFIANVYWSYEDTAFIIKTNNGGGALINERYMQNFEVIGNVIQNSDLILK